ncbi:FeoA family protein [Vagococcus humatus]|uniref:Ferrous iron transport protein A n=1 Tax=Vagococcus humatus TaxID=1889241 RepID=A0A429Z6L7_9ENTE|nr:ferrous iron transport protein A [Vagococcus humatus]RST89324.1 ferrous iron transport protein A [Vagococcus humatus]
MKLTDATVGKYYQIQHVSTTEGEQSLEKNGLSKGQKIILLGKNEQNNYEIGTPVRRIQMTPHVSSQIEVEKYEESTYRTSHLCSLEEAPFHEAMSIDYIIGKDSVKRRLMDMGLTKGTSITKINVAPLGDPIEFSVRGYKLTLRQEEAQRIIVKDR